MCKRVKPFSDPKTPFASEATLDGEGDDLKPWVEGNEVSGKANPLTKKRSKEVSIPWEPDDPDAG